MQLDASGSTGPLNLGNEALAQWERWNSMVVSHIKRHQNPTLHAVAGDEGEPSEALPHWLTPTRSSSLRFQRPVHSTPRSRAELLISAMSPATTEELVVGGGGMHVHVRPLDSPHPSFGSSSRRAPSVADSSPSAAPNVAHRSPLAGTVPRIDMLFQDVPPILPSGTLQRSDPDGASPRGAIGSGSSVPPSATTSQATTPRSARVDPQRLQRLMHERQERRKLLQEEQSIAPSTVSTEVPHHEERGAATRRTSAEETTNARTGAVHPPPAAPTLDDIARGALDHAVVAEALGHSGQNDGAGEADPLVVVSPTATPDSPQSRRLLAAAVEHEVEGQERASLAVAAEAPADDPCDDILSSLDSSSSDEVDPVSLEEEVAAADDAAAPVAVAVASTTKSASRKKSAMEQLPYRKKKELMEKVRSRQIQQQSSMPLSAPHGNAPADEDATTVGEPLVMDDSSASDIVASTRPGIHVQHQLQHQLHHNHNDSQQSHADAEVSRDETTAVHKRGQREKKSLSASKRRSAGASAPGNPSPPPPPAHAPAEGAASTARCEDAAQECDVNSEVALDSTNDSVRSVVEADAVSDQRQVLEEPPSMVARGVHGDDATLDPAAEGNNCPLTEAANSRADDVQPSAPTQSLPIHGTESPVTANAMTVATAVSEVHSDQETSDAEWVPSQPVESNYDTVRHTDNVDESNVSERDESSTESELLDDPTAEYQDKEHDAHRANRLAEAEYEEMVHRCERLERQQSHLLSSLATLSALMQVTEEEADGRRCIAVAEQEAWGSDIIADCVEEFVSLEAVRLQEMHDRAANEHDEEHAQALQNLQQALADLQDEVAASEAALEDEIAAREAAFNTERVEWATLHLQMFEDSNRTHARTVEIANGAAEVTKQVADATEVALLDKSDIALSESIATLRRCFAAEADLAAVQHQTTLRQAQVVACDAIATLRTSVCERDDLRVIQSAFHVWMRFTILRKASQALREVQESHSLDKLTWVEAHEQEIVTLDEELTERRMEFQRLLTHCETLVERLEAEQTAHKSLQGAHATLRATCDEQAQKLEAAAAVIAKQSDRIAVLEGIIAKSHAVHVCQRRELVRIHAALGLSEADAAMSRKRIRRLELQRERYMCLAAEDVEVRRRQAAWHAWLNHFVRRFVPRSKMIRRQNDDARLELQRWREHLLSATSPIRKKPSQGHRSVSARGHSVSSDRDATLQPASAVAHTEATFEGDDDVAVALKYLLTRERTEAANIRASLIKHRQMLVEGNEAMEKMLLEMQILSRQNQELYHLCTRCGIAVPKSLLSAEVPRLAQIIEDEAAAETRSGKGSSPDEQRGSGSAGGKHRAAASHRYTRAEGGDGYSID